jgi:hypothetical protein
MTIVSNSASPTLTMCNGDAELTTEENGTTASTSATACVSCRKLQEEVKETIAQLSEKIDRLVQRVDELYQQQLTLKGQFSTAISTKPAKQQQPNGLSTSQKKPVQRKMSNASASEDQPQQQNNLVEMLSTLLGDATQNADGTASLGGVRLEPGVTISLSSDQQVTIEPPTQSNAMMGNGDLGL